MAEFAALAIMALALAAGGFAAQWARLPPAFGYLLTGVVFGVVAPGVPPHGLDAAAEFGILILLFLIGIELDLKRLRNALRSTAWSLPFDLLMPAVLATALARFLGWDFLQAAALGLTVAVSSTLFGEKLASQANFEGKARQRVLGVLISEDVAAGALIAILVVMATGSTDIGTPLFEIARTAFVLVLLAGFGVMMIPRILDEVARRHTPELVVLWAVAIVALFGYLGHLAGSAELGALVAGVAAAEAGSRYVTRNSLIGLRDLAAALFFFAAGVLIDPAVVWANAGIAAALAGVFLFAKQIVHVPAALASGLNLRTSLHAGAGLSTLGEFNLILVAVAQREGLAHPDLRAIIVGAMILLLPASMLLQRNADRIDRRFKGLPEKVRDPFELMARSVRRTSRDKVIGAWQAPMRQLVANLVLLAALAALSIGFESKFPSVPGPWWGRTALLFGVTLTIALPLLRGAYRSYRALVWTLVGLRPGERAGAGKVRSRLVDAWVAGTVVLVLALISLWIPRTLPVLVGGASFAIIVGVVAWRKLSDFHRALESALGRVLGQDDAGARFLDHVLEQYPWGVRFAAVNLPVSSPLIGRSLQEARIGALTGATIAAIQRGKIEMVNPPPTTMLRARDHLILLGDSNQLTRAEALIVAHGDAVRLSAQSLAAEVEEVVLRHDSPWVGRRIGDLQIRETTGTLVVGRWPAEAHHPQPFEPGLQLEIGDRLILLGTPLQLQRARILAEGIAEAT